MARALCNNCQKPEKACICAFFTHIDNEVDVVILRHAKESQHSKNTTPLLVNSLLKCRIIEGENFSDDPLLAVLLGTNYASGDAEFQSADTINQDTENFVHNFLLYPSDKAQVLDEKLVAEVQSLSKNLQAKPKVRLFLIDATWKKAYRMYMLSENLHQIPHLVLPEGIESQYRIRKTKKDDALSTLEATVHALALLEQAPEKYEKLLENFVKFNEFQLSYSQN